MQLFETSQLQCFFKVGGASEYKFRIE